MTGNSREVDAASKSLAGIKAALFAIVEEREAITGFMEMQQPSPKIMALVDDEKDRVGKRA